MKSETEIKELYENLKTEISKHVNYCLSLPVDDTKYRPTT